jgi:NAD(P)-dependent dehydrogenase (short-subunit alcohol dehydrogenase family)
MIDSCRRLELIDSVASDIEARGRNTLRVSSNVCDRVTLEDLLQKTLDLFGKVDALVNCAAKIARADTLSFSEDKWNDILDTNLTGALRKYGRIINIASLNSFVSLSEVAAYAASKAAVVSLTRSLAVEWSRHGVLVNAIAPGVFRRELNQKLLDGTPRSQELLMRTPMCRFGRITKSQAPPCPSPRTPLRLSPARRWLLMAAFWPAV